MDVTDAQKRRNIRKDMLLTSVIGPLSIGIPIVAHILLYPIILSHSGIDTLGLWSLIATISAYFGLTNVGFTSLIIRSVSSTTTEAAFIIIRREHKAATWFYAAATFMLLSIWLLAAWIAPFQYISNVYPFPALIAAVSIQIVGFGIMTAAQLSSAVLSGMHQNYAVQITDIFAQVIRYSLSLAGAFMERPIEGFALGTIFSAIFQFTAYNYRLKNCGLFWFKDIPQVSIRESISLCMNLMKRGLHFYTISLAQIFREPMFRIIIASTLGLGAAGVYEIAFRIPAAIRELATVSAKALFPAFSYYHSIRATEEIRRLVYQTLILLIAFAHIGLLTYALGAEQIFEIWLSVVPEDLVSTTRIATLFWAITVLNIPFWYLLQTNGQEHVAARSLLYHSIATFFIFPLTSVVNFSLQMMMWYWVISSIITQISIYYAAERSTGTVTLTLKNKKFIKFTILYSITSISIITSFFIISTFNLSSINKLFFLSTATIISFLFFLLKTILPLFQQIYNTQHQ